MEILRGPQGTLFGKNTEGRAVRIINKKPTGEGGGYLEAGYGSFHREKFKGAFDFALIPGTLFARISTGSNRSDGYMDVLDFACVSPGLAGGSRSPATARSLSWVAMMCRWPEWVCGCWRAIRSNSTSTPI